ncbi:hypothetical protein ERJ75_001022800 [Trypanosoma vivax]|uniref:Uncharacterized protein n=1 Tax=Trypanosoma vivax (strain Y486) TaxID=1055687 RepID=G0TR02_TRYVY|nr:hypothetical protein TRVL_09137 [Trypanosoma vivax]KAH8611465.1 hypothetical protein ERJ75_001022800 [Trypanosoma vivax]CCC46365.1 conserved hypothetical protein [Trypanosoma vivax Y486]
MDFQCYPKAEEATRFYFVEHLQEGIPYDQIIFPDPFEIPPHSWPPKITLSGEEREAVQLEADPPASTLATGSALGVVRAQRAVNEQQRIRLRATTERCAALQTAAGQMVVRRGFQRPCDTRVVPQKPTEERRRREEMHDVCHAMWTTKNRMRLAWYASHRQACHRTMQTLQKKRLLLERQCCSLKENSTCLYKCSTNPVYENVLDTTGHVGLVEEESEENWERRHSGHKRKGFSDYTRDLEAALTDEFTIR